MKYFFRDRKVGVTDKEVCLLRNGFCYRRIAFNDIESVSIEKGRAINNWFLVLSMGILASSAASIILFLLFKNLIMPTSPRSANFIGYMLMGVVFLMGLGGFAIRESTKKVPVLKLSEVRTKTTLPIPKLEMHLNELKQFLILRGVKIK